MATTNGGLRVLVVAEKVGTIDGNPRVKHFGTEKCLKYCMSKIDEGLCHLQLSYSPSYGYEKDYLVAFKKHLLRLRKIAKKKKFFLTVDIVPVHGFYNKLSDKDIVRFNDVLVTWENDF